MEPIIRQHLDLAREYVSMQRGHSFETYAKIFIIGSKRMQAVLGSPLEMLFLLWWTAMQMSTDKYHELGLEPQREVLIDGKTYRVDFIVLPDLPFAPHAMESWQPIAVEVDGHEFHERTREQVALRDSRDRALVTDGWRVFHFSFAEFTRDPVRCVGEVADFAWSQLSALPRN